MTAYGKYINKPTKPTPLLSHDRSLWVSFQVLNDSCGIVASKGLKSKSAQFYFLFRRNIAQNYFLLDTKEKWKRIKATFGSWRDIDANKLIANIYRWR